MIETARLRLRPWCDADRDQFFALAQDEEVMRYLPALDRAASDNVIDRLMAAQARDGYCFWAVERREDGAVLGFCGLMAPRPPLTEVEIGWRLARDAWGQGFASEAARASLQWAWDNIPEAMSVVAITVPENVRSQAVMDRIGMKRDEGADFDHPSVPEGDPLRRHVLYRIERPA